MIPNIYFFSTGMYVVISRFRVANDMFQEVHEAFINRPRKVDREEGFIRMEVLQPQDVPEEFWLITHWQDRQSWANWYHSHSYKESHQGIPHGLKLDPAETEIRHFELIPT